MDDINSYIYIIKDHKNRCYVGQSTQVKSKSPDSVVYKRIYEHYYNTFHDVVSDASVPLFQDWPLKYLDIEVYSADDGYGISNYTYDTFTKYFIKKGGSKRNSKDTSKIKAFLDTQDKTLSIRSIDNAQSTITSKDLTNADKIDIAEIIWISRMQYRGYQVLNKAIGGQQSGWVAIDINSQKSLFNINNTTPSQLTSFLIATTNINQNRLAQAQQALDNIFDQYLVKSVGDLITKRLNKHKEELKAAISGKEKIDFSQIVLKEVQDTLSGKTSRKTAGLQADLNNFINTYSDLNIKQIDWSLKSKSNELDLFQLITRVIAQSILGPRQNMTLYKNSTEGELTLNYNGAGRMTFKGYQGSNINSNNAQVITIPLVQGLDVDASSSLIPNWWYSTAISPDIISGDIKYVWARQMFKNYFREGSYRIAKPELGILHRIQTGKPDTTKLASGDVVLLAPRLDNTNKLLSTRMLNEYRRHLNYNNDVLRGGNWHMFFSAMYATISKSDWTETFDKYGQRMAILAPTTPLPQTNVESGVTVGLIGMTLTQNTVFVTDKEKARNIIF